MEPVRSRQNRKVVEAARLLRGRHGHRTLLQGEKLVREAVAAGAEIERIFVAADSDVVHWPAGTDVVPVTATVMERLTPTGDTWGPVAVVRVTPEEPRADRPVVVPVGIADPGNLGTIIRSAAAFGYDVVAMGGTDPWSPKVLRAAAGGHFRTHVSRTEELPDRQLVASVVMGGAPPTEADIAADHALLIGSESAGLADDVVQRADFRVTILMDAAESLNAAVAASLLMYQLGTPNRVGRSDPQD